MARQEIDLNTPQPNGKMGEPTKSAWQKVNDMTSEIYSSLLNSGGTVNGTLVISPSGTSQIPPSSGVVPIYAEARTPNVDRVLLTGYKYSSGTWENFDWSLYRDVDGSRQGSIKFPGASNNSFGTGVSFGSQGVDRWGISGAGSLTPASDNLYAFGSPSLRSSVIYSATGSINTSDAREKTDVISFSDNEISAAKDIAKEIGFYKFLSAVSDKGDLARWHAGLTVQRAIEIMYKHGLDPFKYSFICHDSWEEVPSSGADHGIPAGDRYSFRPDGLMMFIARGLEARISEIENRINDYI